MRSYQLFAAILCSIFIQPCFSQSVAINTDGSTANASALLEVKSTVKGLLIPRMSRTERNAIGTPATGLLIFQSSPDSIGFYYYNGSAWTWMFSNSNADSLAWRTRGNASTVDANNFIGTTDNIPFNVRVNNQRAGRIDNTLANAFWGYQAGNANPTGNQNVGIGSLSLSTTNTGYSNTAVGYQSLTTNSSGYQNIAIGKTAMYSNISGVNNTAVGVQSLYQNTTGIDNSAFGPNALFYNNADGNTALGWSALFNTASGNYNTAVGYYPLGLNTTGFSNVAVGVKALYSNLTTSNLVAVGDSSMYNNTGVSNSAIGSKSLFTNSTGNNNTANGYRALYSNSTADDNTATGTDALYSNTTGNNNAAIGFYALRSNSLGTHNVAIGSPALYFNTTAGHNIAIGNQALYSQSFSNSNTAWTSDNVAVGDSSLYANQPTASTNGYQNTAVGNRSLRTNTTGYQNVALGNLALYNNTNGNLNVATGWSSLYKNNSGVYNTANGAMAMYYNTSGNYNVGIGTVALHNNVTGSNNTVVGEEAGLGVLSNSYSNNTIMGYQSGYNLTTGSNNVLLGYQAGYSLTSASNKLYIANSNVSTPLIYGDFSTGNIGFGTTSPSAKLHIGGGTRFISATDGSIFMQSGNGIGSARDWKIYVPMPSGNLSFRDMGFDNLNNGMATDAMVIQYITGNVGIGTTTPNSTLQVDGSIAIGISMGIAGGSGVLPVSLQNYKTYLGLSPVDNTNNNYQLPSPVTYPGRMYIIRNNSPSFSAVLSTAAGSSLYPGSSSTGIATYTLNPSTSVKTVMVISDGSNWTIMKQD